MEPLFPKNYSGIRGSSPEATPHARQHSKSKDQEQTPKTDEGLERQAWGGRARDGISSINERRAKSTQQNKSDPRCNWP